MENKNLVEELKGLKELLNEELLSVEEFENQKKNILSRKKEKSFYFNPELITRISWPLLILVTLIIFYQPVVNKLQQSSEISVGTFSLKVRESAKSRGDSGLASKLEGLSKKAIELLIDAGDKDMYFIGEFEGKYDIISESFLGYLELEKAGFLESKSKIQDLNRWVWSKTGNTRVWYYNNDGSFSPKPVGADPHFEIRYQLDPELLTKEEIELLENTYAKLNVKGREAWDLIVTVVAEQLAKPNI